MGHSTALDGNRKGLRGYSVSLSASTTPEQRSNLVSLDARPEDRASWAAITVSATPNGPLGAADVGALVSAELIYDVDGAGASIVYEVPRLATVNIPAGFVRLRVGLYAPLPNAQTWTVSAQVSLYSAGQRDARARLSYWQEVTEGASFVREVARGCTDAEAVIVSSAPAASLAVLGQLEGITPDATVHTQRGALYGAPCALPMVAEVNRWRVSSAVAGSATLIQYFGP